VRKLLACLLICCSGILLARVQGQQAKSHAPDKFQVFGGYTFQRDYGAYNGFAYNTSCYDSDTTECDPFAPFNANGGQVAFSYYLTHHFGLTYQMTFTTTGDRNVLSSGGDPTQRIGSQSYLAGPVYRYSIMGGGLTLFFHTLFGTTHNILNASTANWAFCYSETSDTAILNCTTNNFTLATGGGVDVRLTRHISVRPAQVEYWTEQIPDEDLYPGETNYSLKYGVDGLRYSVGGVFNF
jgi:hypothetical protein